MPGGRRIAIPEEISKNTYLNIMDQYRPTYKAHEHEKLSRRTTLKEYKRVVEMAKEFGLERGETYRHAFWTL